MFSKEVQCTLVIEIITLITVRPFYVKTFVSLRCRFFSVCNFVVLLVEQQQVELCEQKLNFVYSLDHLVTFVIRFFGNYIIFHELLFD